MKKRAPIERAAAIVGGTAALAKAIGVSSQAVSQWLSSTTRPKAEHAIAIERATAGKVKAGDIRPDLASVLTPAA